MNKGQGSGELFALFHCNYTNIECYSTLFVRDEKANINVTLHNGNDKVCMFENINKESKSNCFPTKLIKLVVFLVWLDRDY